MDVIKSVIDKSKTRKQDAVFTNNRVLIKEGILWKKGKFTTAWKKRLFRVYSNPAHFTYVKNAKSEDNEGVVKLYKGTRVVTAHSTQSHSISTYSVTRENAFSTASTVSHLDGSDSTSHLALNSSTFSSPSSVNSLGPSPLAASLPSVDERSSPNKTVSTSSSPSPIAAPLSESSLLSHPHGPTHPAAKPLTLTDLTPTRLPMTSVTSTASVASTAPSQLQHQSTATTLSTASTVSTASAMSPSGGVMYKLSLSQDVLWELACDDLLELQSWVEAFEKAISSEKGDDGPSSELSSSASGASAVSGSTNSNGNGNPGADIQVAPVWVDDSTSTVCSFCGHSFSVLTRRHHCRKCGNLVCGACTTKMVVSSISYKRVRVCKRCQPGYQAKKEAEEEKMKENEMNKMMKKNAGGGPRTAVPNKNKHYHAPRLSWGEDEEEDMLPYGYYSRHPKLVDPEDEPLSMYGGAGQPPAASNPAATNAALTSSSAAALSPSNPAGRNLQAPLSPHQSSSQLSVASSVGSTPSHATPQHARGSNHHAAKSSSIIDEDEDDEEGTVDARSKGSYSDNSEQGKTIAKHANATAPSDTNGKRGSGKDSDSE